MSTEVFQLIYDSKIDDSKIDDSIIKIKFIKNLSSIWSQRRC